MRVLCAGWKHTDKYHKLMNRDISDVKPSSEKTRYRDEVYIEMNDDGLNTFSGVENLKINGNFSVEVRLSKKEIINLARIALAKDPFGEVVGALSKSTK
jgi:hypothetical protein